MSRLVSNQLAYRREEAKATEAVIRTIKALCWGVFTLVFGLAFVTFAYAATIIDEHTRGVSGPFPQWYLTVCLAVVAFSCFVTAGYGFWNMLDNIFLPLNDRRRINRR